MPKSPNWVSSPCASVFQDIGKCLMALDQLSMVYVTSKHVRRHSELVATLGKVHAAERFPDEKLTSHTENCEIKLKATRISSRPGADLSCVCSFMSFLCADEVLQSQPGHHVQGLHAVQPLQKRIPGWGGGGGGERRLPALPAGGEGAGGSSAGGVLQGEAEEGGAAAGGEEAHGPGEGEEEDRRRRRRGGRGVEGG